MEHPESINHCDNNEKFDLSCVIVSSDNEETCAIVANVTRGRDEFRMRTALATSLFDDFVSLVVLLFSDFFAVDVSSAT